MNATARQQAILNRLDQDGACSYQELAERFRVSSMTIRRDAEALVRRRQAHKTLGGIQRAPAPAFLCETALQSRLAVKAPEKRAIARKALEVLAPRQTLYLDGSTTCLELAKVLAEERKGLTVITNSALVCMALGKNGENTIVGIGGQYDADSLSFVGSSTEDALKDLFVDIAFMSTKGFRPAEGTFESAVANFRVKQIVARRCKRLVLLVDHSKFGQRALRKVLDVAQIHTVITDEGTPKAAVAALKKRGAHVLIAPLGKN